MNIRRLRMKVEEEPSNPKHIVTVWGWATGGSRNPAEDALSRLREEGNPWRRKEALSEMARQWMGIVLFIPDHAGTDAFYFCAGLRV